MCIYIYIHIRHTLIAWAWFLWSRPQTTSHIVLVWPGGDRKIVFLHGKEPGYEASRPHGTGPTKRQSTCEKIVWEPKWSRSGPSMIMLESKDGNKGTLHQNRVRQRRKSLTDTRTKLRSLLKLFRRPLCHLHYYISSSALSTYTLYVVTSDIYLHISGYSSAQGILCTCVILVSNGISVYPVALQRCMASVVRRERPTTWDCAVFSFLI